MNTILVALLLLNLLVSFYTLVFILLSHYLAFFHLFFSSVISLSLKKNLFLFFLQNKRGESVIVKQYTEKHLILLQIRLIYYVKCLHLKHSSIFILIRFPTKEMINHQRDENMIQLFLIIYFI